MSVELENTNKQEQIFYQMTVDFNDTTIHSGILKFSEPEIFGALRMSRAASEFRPLSYSILQSIHLMTILPAQCSGLKAKKKDR